MKDDKLDKAVEEVKKKLCKADDCHTTHCVCIPCVTKGIKIALKRGIEIGEGNIIEKVEEKAVYSYNLSKDLGCHPQKGDIMILKEDWNALKDNVEKEGVKG